MKSIKQLSFIGLGIIIILTSCTMEKRVYMSGYHIDWKKSNQNLDRQELASNNNNKPTEQDQIEIIQQSEKETKMIYNAPTVNDETITASVDNSIIPMTTTPSHQKKFSVITLLDECDNIILKNGDEIKVKVIEITTDEIKYKKCDNLNGPSYSIQKSEVFMIQYPNGTKDVFTSSKNVSDKTQKDTKEKRSGGNGITSFIFSLVGLLVGVIVGVLEGLLFAPTPLIVVAIIFGIKGMINGKLKGLAIAGLVIGTIELIVGLILIAAVL